VRGDRVDAVRVLRLVEAAEDEHRGVQAEVAPDERVGHLGAQEHLRGVQGPGGDDDRVGVDGVPDAVGVGVLDALGLEPLGALLDEDAVDVTLGAQLEPAAGPRHGDVRVLRRLAGVRGAALQAGAALHAVLVGVGDDGLEARAHRLEAARDPADVVEPVGALAHAEHLGDAVVVGRQVVGAQRLAAVVERGAGLAPLVVLVLGRAQGDLRVDRRAAADAAAGDERDDAGARVVARHRHADRPPDVVHRVDLPAGEVRGGAMRADLEQEHAAPLARELAGDHAAARAGADHDDLEALAHAPTPR